MLKTNQNMPAYIALNIAAIGIGIMPNPFSQEADKTPAPAPDPSSNEFSEKTFSPKDQDILSLNNFERVFSIGEHDLSPDTLSTLEAVFKRSEEFRDWSMVVCSEKAMKLCGGLNHAEISQLISQSGNQNELKDRVLFLVSIGSESEKSAFLNTVSDMSVYPTENNSRSSFSPTLINRYGKSDRDLIDGISQYVKIYNQTHDTQLAAETFHNFRIAAGLGVVAGIIGLWLKDNRRSEN